MNHTPPHTSPLSHGRLGRFAIVFTACATVAVGIMPIAASTSAHRHERAYIGETEKNLGPVRAA